MDPTQEIPRVEDTAVLPSITDPPTDRLPVSPSSTVGPPSAPSIAKSSGSMAIATLFSRITGFVWKIQLAGVVGLSLVNDSFTLANTFPNIVYELLIGGVLTSIVVPVLVRAQKDDDDGGLRFTQQLLTLSTALLVVASVIAVIAAPMITRLYMSTDGKGDPELTTAFAYLLLPSILFFGLSAILTAVLNARHVFAPGAWAPVIGNLIRIATIVVYTLLPGELVINPLRMTDAHLVVLGAGGTLSVLVQAVVQIPALRRAGVRLRPRWGWDHRLTEFSGLAMWVVGYVAISQVGFVVVNRVLTSADPGGVTIYANAWLLLQLPYGVLGVSLLTALMPRMSRSAADGRTQDVINDLSMGSRMSAVMLVPISAVMTALGPWIGEALFFGEASANAGRLGEALAASAFGLLPYAVIMLQLRVFYAMKDARVPTLIMVVMTAVKVPLSYLCPLLLPDRNVVHGLAAVNSLTFVVGVIVGELWLRRRLGRLGDGRGRGTLIRITGASLVGLVVAYLAAHGLGIMLGEGVGQLARAWLTLVIAGLLGLAAIAGMSVMLRVDELRPAWARISSRFLGR